MIPPIPVRGETRRPFWSIMIPTYAPDLALLRATLESIRTSGLDLAAHQVTLVDDASDDPAVQDFLAEQARAGLEVIRHPQRQGLVGNWNACLHHARGEWVHLLHQDDRVRPGFHAALEEGMRRAPHIGAAFTQTAFVDDAGHVLHEGHMQQSAPGVMQDWIENVIVNLTIQCPAMVVRRAVYERLGGFDPSYTYCSDAEMWQRLAAEYPIWFDPRPLAEYRVHAASATYRDYQLAHRWRERRRCLLQSARRLSPLIRSVASASGRHYLTRLAWQEWQQTWRKAPDMRTRIALLPCLLRLGQPRDLKALYQRRYPAPVPSLAPLRGDDPHAPRQTRLMLLSEFFPHPPDRAVFGIFQRLRRHFEALDQLGRVDAVFFWSDNYQPAEREVEEHRNRLAACWPLRGALRIIATTSGPTSERNRHPLRALCTLLRGAASFMNTQPTLRCCGPHQVAHLRKWLQLHQPDVIFAHRLGPMGPLLRLGLPLPPVILDLDDVEHLKMLRLQGDPSHGGSRRQAWLRAGLAMLSERNAAALARTVLVCSEADRRALRAVAPRARIEVLPNTARDVTPLPPAETPAAIFVGVAYYPPNREAIRWLLTDIWPRVRARVPDARLLVVGEGAADAAGDAETPGVEILGFAPDLEPVYRRAAFAVCPIRRGSGTRIKIIEAALYARPTVATRIGAEGLHFQHPDEILLADDAGCFADACVQLLTDRPQCARLGEAALKKARGDYAPAAVLGQLVRIVQDQLSGPAGTAPS